MSEAIFPLLGTAMVVLLVLPCCALLVKGCLMLAERAAVGMLHKLTLRYLLLTGSSIIPLAWLVSAGLHQAESGRSALACLLDHDATEACLESGYFALALGVAILASSLRALRHTKVPMETPDPEHEVHRRIDRLINDHPTLASLKHRIAISYEPGFALGTTGLLRPRVVVGAHFSQLLSDEMLESALAHELEHVRARDPLRYWVLQFALAINPLGRRFLEPHSARWLAAREAHCDREAVIHGAAPLSLANAIVRAARPGAHVAVALGARDTTALKFRVEMLLAFAERSPTPCCARVSSTFSVALVLLLLTLILPHQTTTGPLDALHTGAEHALTYFSR